MSVAVIEKFIAIVALIFAAILAGDFIHESATKRHQKIMTYILILLAFSLVGIHIVI